MEARFRDVEMTRIGGKLQAISISQQLSQSRVESSHPFATTVIYWRAGRLAFTLTTPGAEARGAPVEHRAARMASCASCAHAHVAQ